MNYKIKTAYKYFDELTQLWNLFTFIEYCTITFCIQSVRKDYTVLTEPKIFDKDVDTNNRILSTYYMFDCCKKGFDIVYIFEKNDDVNKSIYELKQNFGKKLLKQHITKTLYKSTECFTCMCCNWFVYMLNETYKINKQNIIDNGIYAKQVIEFGDNKILEKLEDAIDINKKIITNSNKFVDIVNEYINKKYNDVVFYDKSDKCEMTICGHIPNLVYCDIDDCEFNKKLFDGQNMYYCYDCYTNEYIRDNKYNIDDDEEEEEKEKEQTCYNLCPNHFTEEHICNHKNGTHKFGLWSNELEEFDNYYRLKKYF